jgi:SAM-dependent methyltransferase
MFRALYNWFLCPPGIAAIRRSRPPGKPRLLDVGCGNHGPKIAKRYLPECEYHGLYDRRWNLDDEDTRCMDRAFEIDLESPAALDQVPDGAYDALICSHVLEHLADPYVVVGPLARKLKPGGVFYVEVPSERSLRLPRAANGWMGIRGCLNFRDDDSHKTMVDLGRVSAILIGEGFDVRGPRPRRMWRRVLFFPLYVLAVLAVKRFIPASVMWDVTGFAACLTAVRQ